MPRPVSTVDRVSDNSVRAAYSTVHSLYIEVCGHLDFLDPEDTAFALTHLSPGPVLDVGGGAGHFTKVLPDAGVPATGIDLVPEFIAHARSTYPGIPFALGSLRSLSAPTASVPAILAWFSLIHLPPAELPEVLAEFGRVLAPGGRLVIGYFESSITGPFPHKVTTAYRWSPDHLAEILDHAGFVELARLHHPAAGDVRAHGALAVTKATPSRT